MFKLVVAACSVRLEAPIQFCQCNPPSTHAGPVRFLHRISSDAPTTRRFGPPTPEEKARRLAVLRAVLADSAPEFQARIRWRVKDGDKGPMIWEIKHCRFTPKGEDGLPGEPMHLIVARDVLDPQEIKFFVSNAPPETSIQPMLLVAFSRWRVERCFEDHKGEIGLDHYEGRLYLGLKRHMILSAVSYLFLARMRQRLGGKNPELTECQVHTCIAALIPSWWLGQRPSVKLLEKTAAKIGRTQQRNALTRKCHTKRTRKKLRQLGIRLTDIPRCKWDGT